MHEHDHISRPPTPPPPLPYVMILYIYYQRGARCNIIENFGGREGEGEREREREREIIFNIFIHETEILIKV